MSWNYRVIRELCRNEMVYEIHEVYYNKDGTIKMWSIDPIDPAGDSVEELRGDLELMLKALEKPVLEIDGDFLVEVEK